MASCEKKKNNAKINSYLQALKRSVCLWRGIWAKSQLFDLNQSAHLIFAINSIWGHVKSELIGQKEQRGKEEKLFCLYETILVTRQEKRKGSLTYGYYLFICDHNQLLVQSSMDIRLRLLYNYCDAH